jgi:hypothetical protein
MAQSKSLGDKQKKNTFIKKLIAGKIQGMFATIQFRMFCCPISYQKCKVWNIQNYNFNVILFVWVWNLVSYPAEDNIWT